MNFLLGLLIGISLTVGAAYMHDASVAGADRNDPRLIVNWDNFNSNLKGVRDDVAAGWSRLTGQPRKDERSASDSPERSS